MENLIQQIGVAKDHDQQFNDSHSNLASSVQQLNSSLYAQLSQIYSLDGSIQQLNVSIDAINSSLGSGQHAGVPVPSCAALPPSSPSGYYWVRASNGRAVSVYCDMTRSCGGVTGGWVRVAELDMRNSSQQCPRGLTLRPDPVLRSCVSSEELAGCTSFSDLFTNPNIEYSQVCGRVIGYQYSSADAFYPTLNDINAAYVDGVSITRGRPRRHIWQLFRNLVAPLASIYSALAVKQVGPRLPHHLWGMTISVKLEILALTIVQVPSTVTTLCGMVLVAGLRTHAAPSTAPHGSTSSCHSPPLMTLR